MANRSDDYAAKTGRLANNRPRRTIKAKLPDHINQYAMHLSVMNTKVFPTAKAAREDMKETYLRLAEDMDIQSITGGGYMMCRDAEGDIELWISPYSLWKGKL